VRIRDIADAMSRTEAEVMGKIISHNKKSHDQRIQVFDDEYITKPNVIPVLVAVYMDCTIAHARAFCSAYAVSKKLKVSEREK